MDPVTSPTNELTQMIVVGMGNMKEATVITESGTFTGSSTADTVRITIDLLPDVVHSLEVKAVVREIDRGGCSYVGYTLSTTKDAQGEPLTIEQVSPYRATHR